MTTDVLYIIDTDVLILMFCKNNVLCHIRRTEAVEQFLFNVLLIVVMTAFWVLDSVSCTAFGKIMYHLNLLLYHPDN